MVQVGLMKPPKNTLFYEPCSIIFDGYIVGAKMSYKVWLQLFRALQEYFNNIRCHFIFTHVFFEELEVVTN